MINFFCHVSRQWAFYEPFSSVSSTPLFFKQTIHRFFVIVLYVVMIFVFCLG